jgi:hypothetical protein
VTLNCQNDEDRNTEVFIHVLPDDDEKVCFAKSRGIKVLPFGLRLDSYLPIPLTPQRLVWMHLSSSRPLTEARSLTVTLKYFQSDQPIATHFLSQPAVSVIPFSPKIKPRGSSIFDVKVSVLSRDHQDQLFILQIDPVDEPDVAPFYSSPFPVLIEGSRVLPDPLDLRTVVLECLHDEVIPILREIHSSVTNTK